MPCLGVRDNNVANILLLITSKVFVFSDIERVKSFLSCDKSIIIYYHLLNFITRRKFIKE